VGQQQHAQAVDSKLFRFWLVEAIQADVREPPAMTLSTVGAEGRPSSRVLILKGFSNGGLQFASSRTSRKGRELSATPWAAASFYWRELGRQVRVTGRVLDTGRGGRRTRLPHPLAASCAESLVAHQSERLEQRDQLDAALDEARAQLLDDPGLVPDHWTLLPAQARRGEFWQADRDRRHTSASATC